MGRKKYIDLSIYKGRDTMLTVVQQFVKTGYKMKGKDDDGANGYYFLCPFHKEQTASFTVSRDNKLYMMGPNNDTPRWVKRPGWGFKCYGCGKGGDIYVFLKYMYGYSIPEAIGYLKKMFPELNKPIYDPNQLRLQLHVYETTKNYELFEKARQENKPPIW